LSGLGRNRQPDFRFAQAGAGGGPSRILAIACLRPWQNTYNHSDWETGKIKKIL